MGILEIAEELRQIAEQKAKDQGLSVQEVWSESVKDLDRIFKEREKEKEY